MPRPCPPSRRIVCLVSLLSSFSPRDSLFELLLFGPDPPAPFHSTVSVPHCVIVFRHSFLRKDTASQDDGAELQVDLELDREASIDWMSKQEEVREYGDCTEPEDTRREATGGHGCEMFRRNDAFDV